MAPKTFLLFTPSYDICTWSIQNIPQIVEPWHLLQSHPIHTDLTLLSLLYTSLSIKTSFITLISSLEASYQSLSYSYENLTPTIFNSLFFIFLVLYYLHVSFLSWLLQISITNNYVYHCSLIIDVKKKKNHPGNEALYKNYSLTEPPYHHPQVLLRLTT